MRINCTLLEFHTCQDCDFGNVCYMRWKNHAYNIYEHYKEAYEQIAILKKQTLDLIDVHDSEICRLREKLKCQK